MLDHLQHLINIIIFLLDHSVTTVSVWCADFKTGYKTPDPDSTIWKAVIRGVLMGDLRGAQCRLAFYIGT